MLDLSMQLVEIDAVKILIVCMQIARIDDRGREPPTRQEWSKRSRDTTYVIGHVALARAGTTAANDQSERCQHIVKLYARNKTKPSTNK